MSEAHAFSAAFVGRVQKPRFLQNVGVEHQPTRSSMTTLTTELEKERSKNAALQNIVNYQNDELALLTAKVKEGEEKQAALEAKFDELYRSVYQPGSVPNP